jgi:DNA-binding transcriptional LysR family regulator
MTIRNINGERFTLLATFKAIYENGGISSAAEVQGLTQSAVSKQLQKLREWFKDELFVRAAGRMEPTGKAVSLIERVEHISQEVAILSEAGEFYPALHLKSSFKVA